MSSNPSALTLLELVHHDPRNATAQCLLEGVDLKFTEVFWLSMYLGTNGGWFLLGIILTQIYNYYTHVAHTNRDLPWFKLLVYAIVFVAIAETASDTFVSYYSLVLGWGDTLVLVEPTNIERAASDQNNLVPLFDILPAILVQFFFVWRIWTFSMAVYGRRVKWLVAFACLFIVLTSSCAIVSAVFLLVISFVSSITDHVPTVKEMTLVWTVSTTAADVTITACMIAILRHAKASTCFGETHDKISRLQRITIQTGFLSSIFATCATILSSAPNTSLNTIYTLSLFLLGKSYTITLLANLNVSSARNGAPATVPATQLSRMSFAPAPTPNDDNSPTNASGGVVASFLRSVARTIRNDLISVPQ